MTNEIEKTESCSQCEFKVKRDGKRYAEYMETLEILFPKVKNVISPISADGKSVITVTNLAGECTSLSYQPHQTIHNLKEKVKGAMHVMCEKQVLLYKGVELKVGVYIYSGFH